MKPDPLHPAAWVIDTVASAGWTVHSLLGFTRASTLLLVSRDGGEREVLKAGFGSNHLLAELDDADRPAAYGFYWYQEMTPAERALTRADFRHEIALTDRITGATCAIGLRASGTMDRFDWYTMAYCPEGNFRPLLLAATDPNLAPAAVARGLRILTDAATGLLELHARGIVHRDVYQENILLRDGRGIITDLGAARTTDTPHGPAGRGPEVHWPPEYAHSYATATATADVFSLAVLTYRFGTGDLPRIRPTPATRRLPAELTAVVLAALSPHPGERPSMTAFRDALAAATDPVPLPTQRTAA